MGRRLEASAKDSRNEKPPGTGNDLLTPFMWRKPNPATFVTGLVSAVRLLEVLDVAEQQTAVERGRVLKRAGFSLDSIKRRPRDNALAMVHLKDRMWSGVLPWIRKR